MSERDENLTDFIACVPHEIQADSDVKYGPLLVGFPLGLVLTGTRKPKNGDESVQIVSSVLRVSC